MTDDPMKLLEEARDKLVADAFHPGDTDGFRHINYCRYCHYSESHRHGDDCIISRIDACLATGGWMPIETAPKDGTILLRVPTMRAKWNEYLPLPGYWEHREPASSGFWVAYNHAEAIRRVDPTHWQPLPPLPKKG